GYPLGALAEPPAARAAAPFAPGDVVGTASDAVYLRIRRMTSTELLRVPLAGGGFARVATEIGSQQATLAGDRLYWMAPSEEAAPNADRRCVRTLAAGGAPQTVTDWLSKDGTLV